MKETFFYQMRGAKGLLVPEKIVSNVTFSSENKHKKNEIEHFRSKSSFSSESEPEKECCGQIFACELRSLIAKYRKTKNHIYHVQA